MPDDLIERLTERARALEDEGGDIISVNLLDEAATRIAALEVASFQARVGEWMPACFGAEISADRIERNYRFLEEALELVQANGCTEAEARQLVAYVYGRPQGDINQEVGGVMVTLAALCLANGEDMQAAAEKELARIWTKIDQIRAKQAAKPKHSALSQATAAPAGMEELVEAARKAAHDLQHRLIYDTTMDAMARAASIKEIADVVLSAVAPLIAAAEREKVAAFMMQHSLATGHGDTIEDLLVELGGQIEELRAAAIRGGEGEVR